MTVNIDWKLMQSPNVMTDYIVGLQQGNELGRQQGQGDLLSGVHALRQIPVGANGDTSARRQAAARMLPGLMQRYPNLDPQALQQLDLSDEGLSRAERYLGGG
jgi:hypothetical protein